MDPLEKILSERGEAVPETKTTQDVTTEAAATETATAETSTEQTTETTETDGKGPPIGAIRQAEREKATKRYTEQVADFEKKLAEQNEAWDRRFRQLLETVKPKAEPQQAPDFFEKPNEAVLHTVEPYLNELRQSSLHNGRLVAEQVHSAEKVKAADDAFTKAYQSGQLDPADYQRVIRSPNIYDAAVRWHRRQIALAEIGDDPDAYKERVKTELMAELGASKEQPAPAQNGAPVMPSNFAAARNVGSRTGPAWSGPAPLDQIFAERRQATVFKR